MANQDRDDVYVTTLFENLKSRTLFLKGITGSVDKFEGVEVLQAISEELDRMYEKLMLLEERLGV